MKRVVFYATILHLTILGTTWANEMNIVKNHAPSAESIVRPIDLQSSALSLFLENPQSMQDLDICTVNSSLKSTVFHIEYN